MDAQTQLLSQTLAMKHPQCPVLPLGDLWIFGYGSLMWDPGFPYLDAAPALLRGYHRSFCIWSSRYRGTPEQPGLVLGLGRGGACRGIAFRVAQEKVADVVATLWVREMSRLTYLPRLLRVGIRTSSVKALTFVADPRHASYAGRLSDEEVARRIVCCAGARGPNIDYLTNTLRHLESLGVHDAHVARIYEVAQRLSRATQ